MPEKDYYRVLNISSSASTDDIKKAFRKLAFQYHPDKNRDTQTAAVRFLEIQEAYSILSDRKKRVAYNYLRYTQNPQWAHRPVAQSPEDILQLVKKLSGEVALMDPFRVDRDRLLFGITDILSNNNLALLSNTADTEIIRRILNYIIRSAHPLPLANLEEIAEKVKPLTGKDKLAEKEWQQFMQMAQRQYYWGRYKVYIALAAAVLFCVIVFFSGK